MLTLIQLLAMLATFTFGFLTAFTDDFIISAYSALCFIGLGALTVALMFVED